jgi:predicted enzyme related to lactoylglutathione lyase
MTENNRLPGKFVWFELVTSDSKKAQTFYAEVLGWKTVPFPMGNSTYDMIQTGDTPDTMIGGFAPPKNDSRSSYWISYVSVEDVDATAKAASENGGKVVVAPFEIPTVGRSARLADAQGAEFCVLKTVKGDPPDKPAQQGQFFWNELHTSDPAKALTFYNKALGYSHRSVDMGQGGTYHILSQGGIDRGGVTGHLQKGMPPHWLPYVDVDNPDATIARAMKLGAKVPMSPEDIPGIGRFGILQDPTGATLAVMKPTPAEKKQTA